MRNSYILLVLLFVFSNTKAQKVQEIASKTIEQALPVFDQLSDFKNVDQVKLVGLGDVAEFGKQSKQFNAAFSAYLIQKKKFRNILVSSNDWELRPLNTFLTGKAPADTAVLDSVLKNLFADNHKFRNREFRALLHWVKKYNLSHPLDMVNLYGVAPNTIIPPSYFLAAYIYPLGKAYGAKLSEKWSDNNTPDSVAYADIKTWANNFDSKKALKAQQLIERCNQDLLHNKAVLQISYFNQNFPPALINARAKYIAGRVESKLDKKTIFYTTNPEVAKANLDWSMVGGGTPVASIGKYLDEDLKAAYCAFVTDFSDPASLSFIDIAARRANTENVPATENAKTLRKINDYVEGTTNKEALKGYQPIFLPPLKELYNRIIVQGNITAVDGVFILSQLSDIDLRY